MTKPTHSASATGSETTGDDGDAAATYDRQAIFHEDGPFNPDFIREAVRAMMRTMPLDAGEPPVWGHRRMYSAMLALGALHPRDEIEVLLGVQALAAWQAAAACWRLGMNHHMPNGDSTRHLTTAANAARTFDSLLRALERRQAKPLGVPVGRPPSRVWDAENPTVFMQGWEARCRAGEEEAPEQAWPPAESDNMWTADALSITEQVLAQGRIDAQQAGLDIANIEGILPGGGMIVPENPTPQQEAYMGRRLGLGLRDQWTNSLRNGAPKLPKLLPIRPGDLIP